MKLNTPNKLTLLRICMVPLYMVFLLLKDIPHNYLWALIIFSAASLTDLIDGYLARKNNQVTDFGKFLDPLADKMLVVAAFVCFVEQGLVGSVVTVIILFREFLVTSLRLVAAGGGKVIAAGMLGKIKTCTQIGAIVIIMLLQELTYAGVIPAAFPSHIIYTAVVWIAALFTIISGVKYLVDNRGYINPEK